ncbi:MAG: response regulator, partial [Myxococcales bacterium]
NLLNAMTLRMHLLRESPTPDAIDSLNRSVSDIANLVARLQQFANPRPAGPVEPTHLNAVLGDALALVRPEVRGGAGSTVHVEHALDESGPVVRANPSELREILVNILLQARDDLVESGRVRVCTSTGPAGVECRISWGEGGQTDRSEGWFEPFAGGAPPALSFALASARAAVSRWDGSLDARVSETGETEFVFTLKPAEGLPRSPAAEAGGQPAQAATGHRTVLVIDDDPDNASMLAEVLTAEGHLAVTATTGVEAIAQFQRRHFDVALIDLVMPDMSGVEIATELARMRPGTRLALVTGWELSGEEREKAPVETVIRKPVDLDLLLRFLGGEREEPAGAPAP